MKKKIKYKDVVLQVKVIQTKTDDDKDGLPVFSVTIVKGKLEKSEINEMMAEVKRQMAAS